jgi:hypothetical protein
MSKDETLKLVLEAITTYLSESPDPSEKAVEGLCDAASAARKALAAPVQPLPFGVGGGLVAIKTLLSRDPCVHANTAIEMIDAILKGQPAPVQEFVCSTGLCHYKPAAPDLQAELDATNRQVEILSDALAESRREVAALKAVQEPVALQHRKPICDSQGKTLGYSDWKDGKGLDWWPHRSLYTTPPAAQRQCEGCAKIAKP